MFVHDEQELALYDFPMGGVCLEEFLDLDRQAPGTTEGGAGGAQKGVRGRRRAERGFGGRQTGRGGEWRGCATGA